MKLDFQTYLSKTGEIGFVDRVSSYLVSVSGLPGAKSEEVVVFENGEVGEVFMLRESSVEILSFSRDVIIPGSKVARTNRILEVGVGEELLGSLIDPLGRSLDPRHPLPPMKEKRPLSSLPPGIAYRAAIRRQCMTGITLIDLLLPLGKGQRELVVGDQKTGKSRVLLRILLSQVKEGAVGIYAIIGKSHTAIRQIEEALRAMGIGGKTIVVASGANDPSSLIYLTPYTAMTIAEYFRDKGKDVVLVLDDLSIHAKSYREIALLSKKFPGRNSYPGDIFYFHARLLERAGNFKVAGGEAAITCIPVVEVPQGDITGYISTNVMSMTDGHLFFDHILFAEGRRPAIDPFLSVTRVGRQTQKPLSREISRTLTTFLKNAQSVKSIAGFGAEFGEHIRRTLEKYDKLMQVFDQTAYDYVPPNVQILLFGLVWGDAWRQKSSHEVERSIQKIIYLYETKEGIRRRIDSFIESCDSIKALTRRADEYDVSKEIT
jgi:F-type H+-transporting ATPase subunit alpha